MEAQKLRGREKILSARIAPILVFATLLLSAPLAQAVPVTTEITGNVTSIGGPASAEFDFTISSVYINGYFPLNDQSLLVEGAGVEGVHANGNSYIEIQNTTPYEWRVGGVGRAILYAQSSINIYGGETSNVYTQNNSNMNIYDGWLGSLIIADDSSATLYGGNIGSIRNTQFVPFDTEINLEVVCKSWAWDESTNHINGIWGDDSSFDISLIDTSWENFESYRMIDHISFTVIPEPSTITLLLTMCILFLRRRRKTMKAQKLRGRKGIVSARIATFLVFATLILPAPLARAVPITIEITGEVTSVGGYTEAIPDTIYEGVAFSGTYTYESSTDDSGDGHYLHDAPYGISIALGGYEFRTILNHVGQFDMWIMDDHLSNGVKDYYLVRSYENVADPSVDFIINSIEWNLWDSTHTALSSGDLPATVPVLTYWDHNVFNIFGLYGPNHGGVSIYGTVTQAVPEPLTGVLMVIGVFFLKRRGKTMKAQKSRGRKGFLSMPIATILVFATLLLPTHLARAVPVTIEITGEVTNGDGSLWGGNIYDGTPFTGTYTYDSSAPDSSASSDFGWYVFDSPYGINISLGGIEFKTSPSHIGQFEITISNNGPNLDYYHVGSNQNTPLSDGATIDWINWGVYGPNEMLSSTDLPITAPLIDQWDTNLFIHGRDVYGNGYNIYGTVSQAELVPEPATIALMMIGVFLSRRRR